MLQVKRIAIVWESETGGGVNSCLRYLLQSKSSRVRNLVSYLDTDDSDGFGDFEDWVTKLDKSRNQNFSETFPELYKLIY